MPFTIKFITYWRNVNVGSLQLNLAKATTPLHSYKCEKKKEQVHSEITAQGDNSERNKCAKR